MSPVSLKQARERLGDLVRAVERGEPVVITRRGREVARLVPVERSRRGRLPDLTAFRASLRVSGKSLTRELLDQRSEERGT